MSRVGSYTAKLLYDAKEKENAWSKTRQPAQRDNLLTRASTNTSTSSSNACFWKQDSQSKCLCSQIDVNHPGESSINDFKKGKLVSSQNGKCTHFRQILTLSLFSHQILSLNHGNHHYVFMVASVTVVEQYSKLRLWLARKWFQTWNVVSPFGT